MKRNLTAGEKDLVVIAVLLRAQAVGDPAIPDSVVSQWHAVLPSGEVWQSTAKRHKESFVQRTSSFTRIRIASASSRAASA